VRAFLQYFLPYNGIKDAWCGNALSAQIGEKDKATGKKVTTEGYSLESNVTYKNIDKTAISEAVTTQKNLSGGSSHIL
jgi:hypothetical protein